MLLLMQVLDVHTGIEPGSILPLLDWTEGVNWGTQEQCFDAFNLEVSQNGYTRRTLYSTAEVADAQHPYRPGKAIDVPTFYGRREKLATLE